MLQQTIAIIIVSALILRLYVQKQKKEVTASEFSLWLAFWLLAALAIIFIKQIDQLVASLGFSGSGINFLIYLAVLSLFYLIFRLRLSLARMDRALTELARIITLNSRQ